MRLSISCAIRILLTLSLIHSSATFTWADRPDPTIPSPQIVKRLALDSESPNSQETQNVATKKLPLPRLRLKAIVLRDKDNGTALVSDGGKDVYTVKLKRSNLHKTPTFNIGGLNLTLTDFSSSTVIMHSSETNQQFTVN